MKKTKFDTDFNLDMYKKIFSSSSYANLFNASEFYAKDYTKNFKINGLLLTEILSREDLNNLPHYRGYNRNYTFRMLDNIDRREFNERFTQN